MPYDHFSTVCRFLAPHHLFALETGVQYTFKTYYYYTLKTGVVNLNEPYNNFMYGNFWKVRLMNWRDIIELQQGNESGTEG